MPTALHPTHHQPHPPSPAVGPQALDLAGAIAAIDPTLLAELAATAITVDAHALALEAALRRFRALEARLGQAVQRLEQVGRQITETEFAALLDYLGDSDVRVRVEQLHTTFPP